MYDFNKDGQVNSLDQLIARANEGNKLPVLVAPAITGSPLGTTTAVNDAAVQALVADLYSGTLDSDLLSNLASGRKKS